MLVFAVAVMLFAVSSTGCGVMINKMGEALVSGNSVYATTMIWTFVWEAVPFGLKTIEGLLIQAPENKTLLLAARAGSPSTATLTFSRMRLSELMI